MSIRDWFRQKLSCTWKLEPGEVFTSAGRIEETREELASKLIDAWCADKGKKIPWAKAVQIVCVVTRLPDATRDSLLRMGDEGDHCQMCGQLNVDKLDFDTEWVKFEDQVKPYDESQKGLVRIGFKIARNALRK